MVRPKRRKADIMDYGFSKVTPEITRLAEKSIEGYRIDPELYTQYDVNEVSET